MQFSVSDIRALGNKKILNSFCATKQGKEAFFERLRIQNMLLSDFNSSAYSLPKRYNSIKDDLKYYYIGIIRFTYMCEPMLDNIENPDQSIQRKFRNQWDSLWKCFSKDIGISQDTCKVVKNLGIRLCYFDEPYRLHTELCQFYNSVISWYVFTLSEGSIESLGFTPLELIEKMILEDSSQFLNNIDCSLR